MISWFYSLIAIFIISFISLVGVLTLSFSKKVLEKLILFLVAFAAGGLLGDAFIHLIPEASRGLDSDLALAQPILLGFLIFFVLEKFLKWRHCHDLNCDEHHQELGTMNLVADGLHNLIDGAVITVSFFSSVPLGLATSLAVAFHELPQEIGDFAVLIHSGMSRKKTLTFNFLSALTAFLGAVLVLGTRGSEESLHFLLSLTAGGFIYIAASCLIPQLHKEMALKKSACQFLGLVLGMGMMALLLLLE